MSSSWWDNLELGLKFSLVLAGLIVITISAALIKVALVKKREKKLIADLEAAKCHDKEDEHTLVKRELDEGDLFGVRALEAGFTGGVHQPQTRPTTPIMNSLKPGLGNMKNASRSGSTTPSRRGSLDVPRLGQHSNGSVSSLKLPTRPVPALSPPGSRSASPAPRLQKPEPIIAAPFKGLEWNGSRPTTPRGSHTPVPILTFSSANNSSNDLSSGYFGNNGSISNFMNGPSSPSSRRISNMSDSSDDSRLSPQVAKFPNFQQHNRGDSSASANFNFNNSSPNGSFDGTSRQQRDSDGKDKGRPILGGGIEMSSR